MSQPEFSRRKTGGLGRVPVAMEENTVERFLEILVRLALGDAAASGFVGVAPKTLRKVRSTRQLPRRMDARRRVIAFVRLNADATSRGALRPVD